MEIYAETLANTYKLTLYEHYSVAKYKFCGKMLIMEVNGANQ